MKMADEFKFQKFTVRHDRCAMKVGTDAVVLGAWARCRPTVDRPAILDVGTGSGVIALILAQRFNAAQIRGIELDAAAAEQCSENFRNSPWKDRLSASCISFRDYAAAHTASSLPGIDLLVCNPPFFAAGKHLDAAGSRRKMARQDHHLPLEELIRHGSVLLSKDGNISLVLPFSSKTQILKIAGDFGMAASREVQVHQLEDKPPGRLLIELKREDGNDIRRDTGKLVLLRSRKRNDWTGEYRAMTEDLYLPQVNTAP